jgi:hypothetical protein
MHAAVRENNLESLKAAIANGEDINGVDQMSRTPLHLAAWKGDAPMVQFLLRMKASLNMKAKDNFLPLHFAILSDSFECCQLLVNAATIATATSSGEKKILESRLSKGNKTALHLAANKGNYQIVELLLNAGVDPCALTNKRQTALEFAKDEAIYRLIKERIERKIEREEKKILKRKGGVEEEKEGREEGREETEGVEVMSTQGTEGEAVRRTEREIGENASAAVAVAATSVAPPMAGEKIIKLDLNQRKKKKSRIGVQLSHLAGEEEEG